MTRTRSFIAVSLCAAVVAWCLSASGAVSSEAMSGSSASVGSFGIGDSVSAGIDERTGVLRWDVPVGALPGLSGDGVVLELTYSQESADHDRFGLGHGIAWSGSFVDVENPGGGVRVHPGSGGVFESDTQGSYASGLARYPTNDVIFSHEPGVLPVREGIGVAVEFSYSLAQRGVGTEYFNAAGDRVAIADVYGNRTDFVWVDAHRLERVIDDGGNVLQIVPVDHGFDVVSPVRVDGVRPVTSLVVSRGLLDAIVNPVGERIDFFYANSHDGGGLLAGFRADGVETRVEYQVLSDGECAVSSVIAQEDGHVLFERRWRVEGENTASGRASGYTGAADLWSSGDGQYRYRTLLDDGATRLVSTFNSLGLLVERDVVVSSPSGDVAVRAELFSYPLVSEGGWDPRAVPANYSRPTTVQRVFRDGAGRSRSVVEESKWDDQGRVVWSRDATGAVTVTRYDDTVRGEFVRGGLVVEQTVTGSDGLVSQLLSEVSAEGTSVVATEKRSGTVAEGLRSNERHEFTVDRDGFVSAERVIVADSGESPGRVESTWTRSVTDGRVTVEHRRAVGTPSESVATSRSDLASGLLVSETDEVGRSRTVSYDEVGRVVSETDFAGRVTRTEYGRRVTRVTSPDGVTRSEHRDGVGRLTRVTDNIRDGVPTNSYERLAERRTYDVIGSILTTVDAHGTETRTTGDVFGRPTRVDVSGISVFSEYDDVQNTVTSGKTVGSPLSHARMTRVTQRDDADRVVRESTTRRDGVRVPEETSTLDGLGHVRSTLSGDIATRREIDSAGKPRVSVSSPVASEFPGIDVTTTREFAGLSGESTRKTVTGHDGDIRSGGSRVFDELGRVVQERADDGSVTTFAYTPDGLVSRVEGPKGTTVNSFDDVTRLLVRSDITRAGVEPVSREFAYDAVGRVIAVWDPTGRVETEMSYRYDAFGNRTQLRYPDGKTVTGIFDEHGRRTGVVDTDGNATRYVFDGVVVSRVEQVNAANVGVAGVSYHYDDLGRVAKMVRDNGVETDYTFTDADQIASEVTRDTTGVVFEGEYVYDPHGNVATASLTNSAGTVETTTYRYDMFNRLTESRVFDGREAEGEPLEVNTYDINVSGDVTRHVTSRGDDRSVWDYEYNPAGQLVGVATNGTTNQQTFDDAGNVVLAHDGTRFEYNSAGRVVAEQRGDVRRVHGYWADGTRKSLTTDGSPNSAENVTGMYWDGDDLVTETRSGSGSGSGSFAYMNGSASVPLARGSDSLTEYYVADRHGSTRATVAHDGQLTNVYHYGDYGHVTQAPGDLGGNTWNPIQYAGEYTSPSGTQFLGVRLYNADTMRFTTPDSKPLHNLYAYANNNPINLVDPSGNSAEWDELMHPVYAGVGALLALAGFAMTIPILGLPWTPFNTALLVATAFDVGTAVTQAVAELAPESINLGRAAHEAFAIASVTVGSFTALAGVARVGVKNARAAQARSDLRARNDAFPTTPEAQEYERLEGLATEARSALSEATEGAMAKWTEHNADELAIQLSGARPGKFVHIMESAQKDVEPLSRRYQELSDQFVEALTARNAACELFMKNARGKWKRARAEAELNPLGLLVGALSLGGVVGLANTVIAKAYMPRVAGADSSDESGAPGGASRW